MMFSLTDAVARYIVHRYIVVHGLKVLGTTDVAHLKQRQSHRAYQKSTMIKLCKYINKTVFFFKKQTIAIGSVLAVFLMFSTALFLTRLLRHRWMRGSR